jgi:FtsZ-binding cell division protein ZapB
MADDNGNGRVTLALLGQKLDALLADMKDVKECVRDDHDKLIETREQVRQHTEALRQANERIDGVDTARKWEGRIEAFLAALLAAVGIAKP